jgi:hypothetical protein
MRKTLTGIALFILLALFGVMGQAAADDSPVLIEEGNEVTMSVADGTAMVTVTLENQSKRQLQVGARPGKGARPGCGITPVGPTTLRPHRQQKFTFALNSGCEPDRPRGTNVVIQAGGGKFAIHANPPLVDGPDDGAPPDTGTGTGTGTGSDPAGSETATSISPDWGEVGVIYLVAFVTSTVVLVGAFFSWTEPVERAGERRMRMSLPGLAASWKFSDSWAANVTVITAIFTGLFGADKVATELLGSEAAKSVLAIAIVSAAISVGLTGTGPMLLQALRGEFAERPPNMDGAGKPTTVATPPGFYITPVGLLSAAVVTLTATSGQLATILIAVLETDFGDDKILVAIGIVAGMTLLGYAVATTRQTLTVGATLGKPSPPVRPETKRTVATLWQALRDQGQVTVGSNVIPDEDVRALLEDAAAPAWPAVPARRMSAIF